MYVVTLLLLLVRVARVTYRDCCVGIKWKQGKEFQIPKIRTIETGSFYKKKVTLRWKHPVTVDGGMVNVDDGWTFFVASQLLHCNLLFVC